MGTQEMIAWSQLMARTLRLTNKGMSRSFGATSLETQAFTKNCFLYQDWMAGVDSWAFPLWRLARYYYFPSWFEKYAGLMMGTLVKTQSLSKFQK